MSGQTWPRPANWVLTLEPTLRRDAELRQIKEEIREHNAALRKLRNLKKILKHGEPDG